LKGLQRLSRTLTDSITASERPTSRQTYAIARCLADLAGIAWPETRDDAKALVADLFAKREAAGLPAVERKPGRRPRTERRSRRKRDAEPEGDLARIAREAADRARREIEARKAVA
jgi:hypothetical protein